MAILTDEEFGKLWRQAYRKGAAKEDMKALPFLPNKTQIKAAFQVFEDFWENNKATVLTDVRTAIGQTVPASLVKALGVAWLNSKFRRGG